MCSIAYRIFAEAILAKHMLPERQIAIIHADNNDGQVTTINVNYCKKKLSSLQRFIRTTSAISQV